MNADGYRLAAANSGSSAASNGKYTWTYGLPTASVWNLVSTSLSGNGSPFFQGIAIANDAARVYAAGNPNVEAGSALP